ncbi:amidase [Litchfieldella rifensis]|uniref:Amidase n=1 Tax=Litchfieldella rifensis TaxID=762643 RepID=A0ABV7LU60_9GAMM
MHKPETDLAAMDAAALIDAYRHGRLSPVEAVANALERIDCYNPVVNAFCHVDHEGALAAAHEAEARWQRGLPRGPVDGLPVTMKDLTRVRGMPAREGTLISDPAPCDEDAPPARRLRDGGAVILGKTTTPEYGWKGVTDSPLTGVTYNPWDTRLTPGGSSGGAAAACALNLGVLHQGGDSGGSIRIPASFTGTFGFKSTFGLVPQWPPCALPSMSHIGPITRSVDDAIRMLNVIGRYESRDSYAIDAAPADWGKTTRQTLEGMRIGLITAARRVGVDPQVTAAVERAAKTLTELGAEVVPSDLDLHEAGEAFKVLWFTTTWRLCYQMTEAERHLISSGLLENAWRGEEFSANDVLVAEEARATLTSRFEAHFRDEFDLLLMPSVAVLPFAAGQEVPEGKGMNDWMDWTPFSYPFNLTRQPAASVPCGFSTEGLPIGCQLVGARFQDRAVLRASRAYMRAVPPRFPIAPCADEQETA